MKVTAFLGSPRAQGNTDTLTERLLAGAQDAGCETGSYALRRLNIRPCTDCQKCWDKEPCVFDDDMTFLYQAIADSDVLVFATPVYWYAPTAIMKGLLDRMVVFNRPQGRQMIEGKKVVLITAYEEDGPAAAEPLVRMFEMSFDYLGLQLVDKLIVGGVGPKGAVLEKPDALEQAYLIGKGLMNGMDSVSD